MCAMLSFAFVESGSDIWRNMCNYKILPAFGDITVRNIADVAAGVRQYPEKWFEKSPFEGLSKIAEAAMAKMKAIASKFFQEYF